MTPPPKLPRTPKTSTVLKSVVRALCAGVGDSAGCNDHDTRDRIKLLKALKSIKTASDLKALESKIRRFVAYGDDRF